MTGARGLPTATMARFASRFATARPAVPDRALERNQALRFAALDAQHVVTLLAYVANLAAGDGDDELRAFCSRWERKLRNGTARSCASRPSRWASTPTTRSPPPTAPLPAAPPRGSTRESARSAKRFDGRR